MRIIRDLQKMKRASCIYATSKTQTSDYTINRRIDSWLVAVNKAYDELFAHRTSSKRWSAYVLELHPSEYSFVVQVPQGIDNETHITSLRAAWSESDMDRLFNVEESHVLRTENEYVIETIRDALSSNLSTDHSNWVPIVWHRRCHIEAPALELA